MDGIEGQNSFLPPTPVLIKWSSFIQTNKPLVLSHTNELDKGTIGFYKPVGSNWGIHGNFCFSYRAHGEYDHWNKSHRQYPQWEHPVSCLKNEPTTGPFFQWFFLTVSVLLSRPAHGQACSWSLPMGLHQVSRENSNCICVNRCHLRNLSTAWWPFQRRWIHVSPAFLS